MGKRLLVMLVTVVFLASGCIGVGYHGEARIGGHDHGHWSLSLFPYMGFFMYPGFFGYYGGPHHHSGQVVIQSRPYVYRGPPPHAGPRYR